MPVYTDPKTGNFFIQFDYKCETHKFRLKPDMTKDDAKKLEVKLKNKLFFESHGIVESKEETLFETFLVETYLPHVEANHSDDSFQKAVNVVKIALIFLKGKAIRSIKAADIEKIKTHIEKLPTQHKRSRKPATVAREMSCISKYFSLAVKNDECDYNPCSRVEMPTFDNVQDETLDPAKEVLFFSYFKSDWSKDVCGLILNTGLRQKDALGLSKFQVNFETEEIVLIQGKTKRRVVIPMNEKAMEIIRRNWNNGSELVFPSPKTGKQGKSIRTALAGACKRAGIKKIGSQIARRSYGTRLHENGYDDSTVAQLLGHSDLRSVHRYKRGQKIKRQAVDSLVENGNPARILPLGVASTDRKAVNG